MTAYELLLLAHVVLFAYWLGADVGVFYSSYRVCDPTLGREARLTALRIMAWIDMIPRYCLVVILPVGLSLAIMLGAWRGTPGWVEAAVWVAAAAWLWLVRAVHDAEGRPLGARLRRIDLAVRVVAVALLVGTGVAGLLGAGPATAPWLAAKVLIFGLLVFCGLMIRLAIRPFGPALARLVAEGSTPALEAELAGSMRRARPFVVAIWIGLVLEAWLGIAKPALGG